MSLSKVSQNRELVQNSTTLLITRSDKPYSNGLKGLGVIHETRLAPSWELYNKAQQMKQLGNFDNWYDAVYKQSFIKGLKIESTLKLIKGLANKLEVGEDVTLICFCTKERCHRHIISDILHRLSNQPIVELVA